MLLGIYVRPIAFKKSYGDGISILVSSERLEKPGIELTTPCLQFNPSNNSFNMMNELEGNTFCCV